MIIHVLSAVTCTSCTCFQVKPNKNTCTFSCHVDFHCQSNLTFCVDKILPKPYRGLPYRHPTEIRKNDRTSVAEAIAVDAMSFTGPCKRCEMSYHRSLMHRYPKLLWKHYCDLYDGKMRDPLSYHMLAFTSASDDIACIACECSLLPSSLTN